MKTNILLIVLCVLAIIIVILRPAPKPYIKYSKLYISEIMASNKTTLTDEFGEYSDYIEIYNGEKFAVDLTGYHLSDDEYDTNKWIFPKGTIIKPNTYMIIFASGKNLCKTFCHTNFKLSSNGEVITLSDNIGNIISKVSYDAVDPDEAVSFKNGSYDSYEASPNKETTGNKYELQDITNIKLIVNEYMSKNKKVSSENGVANDWIELYNAGEDVNLGNLYLGTKDTNIKKYRLPNVTVRKGEYYVVELTENIGFSLTTGEKIILSNGKDIITSVDVKETANDVSIGLKDDKWMYFPVPTKGMKNDTKAFEEWVIN